MPDRFDLGSPPIAIHVKRHGRARRLSLRISNGNGRVSLTLPPRVSLAQARAFAQRHETWLRDRLKTCPRPAEPAYGEVLALRGVDHVLRPAAGKAVVESPPVLEIPEGPGPLGARLRPYLVATARREMTARATTFAQTLGFRVARITMRDTKSRWGSCSEAGNLMFSWRLIMAPPAVADYVAAHEVAHLGEMNHSPAFWALVGRLCPDHAEERRWLRSHGGALLRFDFTPGA